MKTLLEQIRCKKARPYIRQELRNHMEDQIEANIHAGMDNESAEKEAVKNDYVTMFCERGGRDAENF